VSTNAELLELVNSLTAKIDDMQVRIDKLEVRAANVPEAHLTVIAAAIAAYLGEKGARRQPRYASGGGWVTNARAVQHVHHPLYTR